MIRDVKKAVESTNKLLKFAKSCYDAGDNATGDIVCSVASNVLNTIICSLPVEEVANADVSIKKLADLSSMSKEQLSNIAAIFNGDTKDVGEKSYEILSNMVNSLRELFESKELSNEEQLRQWLNDNRLGVNEV